MKLNKIKLIVFFQCLIVCLLFSQTFALNTLRSNQLIFSTGHKISDGVYEGVMTDPIPHNVCYENTNKSACTSTFFSYYTSFADPKTGTINITIDGENKMLRAIVGPMDPEIIIANSKTSIAGFNDNTYTLNMKKVIDNTIQNRDGGGVDTADLLFTSFQIGKEVYGESIWIYHHKEYNEMIFEPYRGMDWTLEPSSPIQFSINAMYKNTLTNAENQKLETYLTKHVLVKDVNGPGGQVCIDNTTSPNFSNCTSSNNKPGLFIKGDVRLDKMFGSVGYTTDVQTGSASNLELLTEEESVKTIGELTVRKTGFDNKHTIVFFGYLNVERGDANDYHRYWMEYGTSCSSSANTNQSTHGSFEYQKTYNKSSSHTFLHVKEDQTADNHTYSFCMKRSQINYNPPYWGSGDDAATATFTFGLVGYALPEQSQ